MPYSNASLPTPFAATGFRPVYHRGGPNHCPGCGKTQWLIGRSTAQCAFCATALPFALAMPQAA